MPNQRMITSLLLIAAMATHETAAFSVSPSCSTNSRPIAVTSSSSSSSQLYNSFNDDDKQPAKKGFFANFFEELDAFVDDATSRRLGNGAAFYGKRKSSFYGEEDSMRKSDKNVADNTEDYRGPSNAGYFKWVPDEETGQLKPVTRLKEINIEKRTRG